MLNEPFGWSEPVDGYVASQCRPRSTTWPARLISPMSDVAPATRCPSTTPDHALDRVPEIVKPVPPASCRYAVSACPYGVPSASTCSVLPHDGGQLVGLALLNPSVGCRVFSSL